MERSPTRPVLRWHGGKWILAPWIIQHLPEHRVYVEPFGGAASVLLRKRRSYAEVWNDLDGDVVNLFRVLRSPRAAELIEALRLTPFARTEFELASELADDEVEEARRLVVRSFMGFGSDGSNRDVRTGFRSSSSRSGRSPAHDWTNYPDALRHIVTRLRSVTIENRDAAKVCAQHDAPTTLHYLDPPYVHSTRSRKMKGGERHHAYRHEMTAEDHASFLIWAKTLRGMVVISGYPTQLYDDALAGWMRIERAALADGRRDRVEVLWINPAAARLQGSLRFTNEDHAA